MSDVPVWMAMGWEPIGDPLCPDAWRTVAGDRVEETSPNRPDCDDMLAWLREQVRAEHPGNTDAIEMWWDPECEDDCYSVTISCNTWSAPTLHAALEAAVIAVGSA